MKKKVKFERYGEIISKNVFRQKKQPFIELVSQDIGSEFEKLISDLLLKALCQTKLYLLNFQKENKGEIENKKYGILLIE